MPPGLLKFVAVSNKALTNAFHNLPLFSNTFVFISSENFFNHVIHIPEENMEKIRGS